MTITQSPAEGTFTSEDIAAARTHYNGECTCQFTPVGPGTYVLPDIDRHCPVHAEPLARAYAERDFTAQCERTVAPGFCTGCEMPASELLPWTPAERLCHRCVSIQLDLLAKAIAEGDGQTVNLVKVRWV